MRLEKGMSSCGRSSNCGGRRIRGGPSLWSLGTFDSGDRIHERFFGVGNGLGI